MILMADPHLRRTVPRARTDDYFTAMERKLRFILEQAQASPPLLVAGDFFDVAKSPQFLEQWVIGLLREYAIVPILVPGQHDLPNHNLGLIKESSLGVLAAAGVINLLDGSGPPIDSSEDHVSIWGVPFGIDPITDPEDYQGRIKILLWHHMVVQEPLWPGQEADKAPAILKKYPQFDIICTGDNHQTFCYRTAPNELPPNHWLVNPGSMMRNTTAQVDHRPSVFKWEGSQIEQVFLPIQSDVLDLSVVDVPREKAHRFGAFVETLEGGKEIGISFDDNLKNYFQANKEEPQVEGLVWEARG